jgi:hypothetical protein
MAAQRESADEKLARIINEVIDAREKKATEAKDPKARLDSLMDRLGKFLDGVEDKGDAPPRKDAKAGDGGESLAEMLGFK